jgi:thioredoxin 1
MSPSLSCTNFALVSESINKYYKPKKRPMTTGIIITLLAITAFVVYSIWKFQQMKNVALVENHTSIKTLTDKSFNYQTKSGLQLVDFWAPWCMPCKMMAPILNELASDTSHNAAIGKVNIDEYQSIAAQHHVRNIPTLILFKDGKEIDRIIGVKSKDYIAKQIRKHQ